MKVGIVTGSLLVSNGSCLLSSYN